MGCFFIFSSTELKNGVVVVLSLVVLVLYTTSGAVYLVHVILSSNQGRVLP
jgi:hypothetical protein